MFADFFLDVLSIEESMMLIALRIIVSQPVCSLQLRSVYFVNVGSPWFSAYIFRVVSSYWIVPFFISFD
jgi:hypothetical protein